MENETTQQRPGRHDLVWGRTFLGQYEGAHCSCGQKDYASSSDPHLIENDHKAHQQGRI